MRALPAEQANEVWTILARHAGASEAGREDFVVVHIRVQSRRKEGGS